MKLLSLPLLLIASCAMAGLYGTAHNQVSYTVAPVYFHEFKFIQFDTALENQNRIGASLVGFMASWWMGIFVGFPIFLAALFVKGTKLFVKVYFTAALIVIAVTFVIGLIALSIGYLTFSPDNLPWWMASDNSNISEPVAFARAGMMHNYSYLGGLIGLFIGLVYTIWKARMSRTNSRVVR